MRELADRTIDVLIGRLRKKLGDSASEPQLIQSGRGVGRPLVSAGFATR